MALKDITRQAVLATIAAYAAVSYRRVVHSSELTRAR